MVTKEEEIRKLPGARFVAPGVPTFVEVTPTGERIARKGVRTDGKWIPGPTIDPAYYSETLKKIIARPLVKPIAEKKTLYQRTLERLKRTAEKGKLFYYPKTPYEKQVAAEEERIMGIGEELSGMINQLELMETEIVSERDYHKYLTEFKKYETKSKEYEGALKKAGYALKEGEYIKEPITLKTFEQRVGRKPTVAEKIEFGFAEKVAPKITEIARKMRLPIKEEPKWLYEPRYQFSITTYGKFLFFSPLMTTAAAAKTKVKGKIVKTKVKGKIVKKQIQVKDITPQANRLEKIWKDKGYKGTEETMKSLMRRATAIKDITQRELAMKNIKSLYEEGIRRGIVKPIILKPKILPVPKLPKPKIELIAKLPKKIPVERAAPVVAKPKVIPKPEVKPEYKDVLKFKAPEVKMIPKEKVTIKEVTAQRARQRAAQAAKQREELAQKVMAETMLRQKTAAQQAAKQAAKLAQKVTAATMLGVTTAQKAATRQQMRYKVEVKPRLKPRIKLKVKPTIAPAITIPIPRRVIPKPLEFKKPKPFIRTPGYVAYVRRRKVWIPVSPVVRRKEAIWFGAKRARRTLAAAFKIKKVAAPISIKRYPVLAKPSLKAFRPYKIVKGKRVPLKDYFIQRREFRLAAPTEVKEIQAARRAMSLKVPKSKGKKIKW